MIFATENAVADILAGRKTQTRRLVKEGERLFIDSELDLVGHNIALPYVATARWGRKK